MDKAYMCDCGSVKFNLREDRLIECANCGEILEDTIHGIHYMAKWKFYEVCKKDERAYSEL